MAVGFQMAPTLLATPSILFPLVSLEITLWLAVATMLKLPAPPTLPTAGMPSLARTLLRTLLHVVPCAIFTVI
jgi:hypothetical protein